MVKHYSEQLDRTFFALSDPTRRAIISNLAAKGTCSVLELAEPFDMSLPAISKHLKLLENAHLITREQCGRIHHLKLSTDPMREAEEWLITYQRFWQSQLDSLEEYLTTEKKQGENRNDPNTTEYDRGSKQSNKRSRRKGL
jgi:DNA-binding transcriptional ArsR family regulator